MMVVRHPSIDQDVVAMAIKFIYHKGVDKKPKPYILTKAAPHDPEGRKASRLIAWLPTWFSRPWYGIEA